MTASRLRKNLTLLILALVVTCATFTIASAQTNLVGDFSTWSYSTSCTIGSGANCVDGSGASSSSVNLNPQENGVHVVSVDFDTTSSCTLTLNILNFGSTGTVFASEDLELPANSSGTRSYYVSLVGGIGYGVEYSFLSTCNAEIHNPSVTYCGLDCEPAIPIGNSCPAGSRVGVVLSGSYPDDLLVCSSVALSFFTTDRQKNHESAGSLPCQDRYVIPDPLSLSGGGIGFNPQGLLSSDFAVYFSLSPNEYIGSDLRANFYFSFLGNGNYIAQPPPLTGTWYLTYHTNDLSYSEQVTGQLSDLYRSGVWYQLQYRNLYTVDEIITLSSPREGGFVSFSIVDGQGEAIPYDLNVFGPHIRDASYPFPPLCQDFESYPISAQPTAQPTPTGTVIYQPTAAYSTPRPTSTPEPLVFSTLPPRVAPTTVSIPAIPPITFPTIAWPTVENFGQTITTTATVTHTPQPTSTPEPTINGLATAEALATAWSEPIDKSLNRYQADANLGFASAEENIRDVMALVAWPVRFAKAVREFSPVTWPAYALIFGMFGIVVLTYVWKFILGVVGMFISILRKLWEVIPFN